ncbi:hypothetical protein SELMODRAFT_179106 [Selaginella moellendorffii]|uniref:Hcy-binding domain-containing protein n=1 Tax=Selaginella moellendorffii TaxID=88036 RepID=D8SED5_SELML|nr:hypothetical protein SELMODRAFT_179106 [Selaginella moellendorffii]
MGSDARPGGFDCLEELVRHKGCVVKDGGFATQLEKHGALLNDPLWSALCLITNPGLIAKVHWEYLESGAEVLVTSSYQATLQGFQSRGISLEESEALLRKSVTLACEARDRFWRTKRAQKAERFNRPLVAASIGSYGAFLADGSEYSGDYGPGMTLKKLKDFHRRRLQILSSCGPDLLAIETIPSKLEAQAFIELLGEEDIDVPAWIAFSSKDGKNVVSGDNFSESIAMLDKCDKVVAVGINCCPPHFVEGLIHEARKATSKTIVVYPNSGEQYDPKTKLWKVQERNCEKDFMAFVKNWKRAGANVIGGCCRTTPDTVRGICSAIF